MNHPIPSELCGALKPEPPQQGEGCVFLPHAGSPGHSWDIADKPGYVDRGIHPDLIEVGDHVTIGEGKVHWVVQGIWKTEPDSPNTVYGLRSGMTDRRATHVVGPGIWPVLTLHSKGKPSE